MPPASRGRIYLRTFQRHASTVPPFKTTQRPPSSKVPPTTNPSSYPNRQQPDGSSLRNAKGRTPKPDAPEPDAAKHRPQRPHQTWGSRLRRRIMAPTYLNYRRLILAVPCIIVTAMHMPYGRLTVNGPSMSPFLNPNASGEIPVKKDVIITSTLSLREIKPKISKEAGLEETELEEIRPQNTQASEFYRGQIVTFYAPHSGQKIAVKRVVGMPGDLVQPLPGYPGGDEPVVVPWNHLWVEGDVGDRKESRDSNTYGPISQNLVEGEVIAIWSSWFKLDWIDSSKHTWPARKNGRVEEDAVMEATVDPDDIDYSNRWKDGNVALILEEMVRQPERSLEVFITNPKKAQEVRKLYNNALFVAEVATSEPEKALARDAISQLEDLYDRRVLRHGLQMRMQPRDRGEIPDISSLKTGEKTGKDQSALTAESWLKKQGWELEKDIDGNVKTQLSS